LKKLYIAGCGIKFLSHLTLEVQSVIKSCDCVVYLVNDPAMKRWVEENSVAAISLDPIYFGHRDRKQSYNEICQKIIDISRHNAQTCFLTYGHPLFLANSSQQLIEDIGRTLPDIDIAVLPGISSLDVLLCDLRIDPGSGGIQAYEANELLSERHSINPNSHLIVWQIGVAGIHTIIDDDKALNNNPQRSESLTALTQKLQLIYGADHPVFLYVASMYPAIPCEIHQIPVSKLAKAQIHRLATAYFPPLPPIRPED